VCASEQPAAGRHSKCGGPHGTGVAGQGEQWGTAAELDRGVPACSGLARSVCGKPKPPYSLLTCSGLARSVCGKPKPPYSLLTWPCMRRMYHVNTAENTDLANPDHAQQAPGITCGRERCAAAPLLLLQALVRVEEPARSSGACQGRVGGPKPRVVHECSQQHARLIHPAW